MKKWGFFSPGVIAFLPLLGCQEPTVGAIARELKSESYRRVLETPNHIVEVRLVPEALYYLTFSGVDSLHRFNRFLLDSIRNAQDRGYGLMFTLTLSPKVDTLLPTDFSNDVVYGEITGEPNYRNTLSQFISNMPGKVWLEVKGKRHELRTYHMSNSWGMSKSRTFTLVFDAPQDILPNRNEAIDVVVENLVPGQGRNKFHWSSAISKYDFPNG